MQYKLLSMHKVLLSIGTNTDTRFNLNRAISSLLTYFPTIQFTEVTESSPYGNSYVGSFLNALAFFHTDLCKEELVIDLKKIEKSMGRLPNHKAEGKVIIDIDLIKWDDEIIKPEDFQRSYITDLLEFVND